jgi:polyribonucleotide nucleotidyltransferase
MERVLAQPRADISPFAPRMHAMMIPKEKIRDIIGPGGKTIRAITEETGCQIEIDDDGRVVIASPDRAAAARAIEMIQQLSEVPEVGKTYTGQVRRVESYGAFVQIIPGTDGLLHISEMAHHRIDRMEDELNEGDEVTVKVVDIDATGRIRLSRKALLPPPEGGAEPPAPTGYGGPPPGGGRSDRGDRGGRGGGRGDGDRRRRGGRPPRG